MKGPKFGEGTWIAVPLRDEGFAVGRIARAKRSILLGYFFGIRFYSPPLITDVEHFTASEAILVGTFGYLGLKQGKWPVLGKGENWDRTQWPMPRMVRHEEITGRILGVHYDDDDPSIFLGEEVITAGEAAQGPEDGLMGAGFVELALTALINDSRRTDNSDSTPGRDGM